MESWKEPYRLSTSSDIHIFLLENIHIVAKKNEIYNFINNLLYQSEIINYFGWSFWFFIFGEYIHGLGSCIFDLL